MSHDAELVAKVAEAIIKALFDACVECGGSAAVLDPQESARLNEPVPMPCERCYYLHGVLNQAPSDQAKVGAAAARAVLDALDLPGRERRAKAEALREFAEGITVQTADRIVEDMLARAAEIDPEEEP